jgi:hypothetical protein
MNAVVFEHVPLADLPEKWRAKLGQAGSATVTVRIEQEVQAAAVEEFTTDDPAFGIWRDDTRTWPTWQLTCARPASRATTETARATGPQPPTDAGRTVHDLTVEALLPGA